MFSVTDLGKLALSPLMTVDEEIRFILVHSPLCFTSDRLRDEPTTMSRSGVDLTTEQDSEVQSQML